MADIHRIQKTMKSILLLLVFALAVPANSQSDEQRMQLRVRESQIIIVAEVIEVKSPVGAWSGIFAVVQRARYSVKEVLKGELTAREIDVGHYVVSGSPTADTDRAQLSPEFFRVGNRLVLFLNPDPGQGQYMSLDMPSDMSNAFLSRGESPATSEMLTMIRRLIAN